MRVSIIIPTLNERDNIKNLVKRIFALNLPHLEIIMVDDSSRDGTVEITRALKKRFPITFILRPKKMGLGSALRDGLALARSRGADIAITMDAGGSHDPARIPEMILLISPLGGGAPPPSGETDLVIGSRRIAGGRIVGWGPARTLMSRAAMEIARRVLGIRARDVTSGFRAYRQRVLDAIDLKTLRSTGYAFQEEMLYRAERAGFRIVELPITFVDRRHGKSKLGIRDIVEFFITVARLKLHA